MNGGETVWNILYERRIIFHPSQISAVLYCSHERFMKILTVYLLKECIVVYVKNQDLEWLCTLHNS